MPAQHFAAQDGARIGLPPTPPPQRSSRLPRLMGLVALLALIAGAVGVLLLQRQRAEKFLVAEVDAAFVQQWQAAQAALMSGDDQRTLALIADLRLAAPDFEPTAVKSLRIAACTNLARAAESASDIPEAQTWWACLVEEDSAVTAGHQGSQNAQDYLSGQAAWASQDFAGAVSAWRLLNSTQPDYADLKKKLYDAYLAYGDTLCAQQDQQGGQAQFVAAQTVDADRAEADAHLAACRLSVMPTSTPLSGPHLAVVANTNTLRVRAGPGLDYPVLDRLGNNTTVTIIGRTDDASWVHVQIEGTREGWVSTEYLIPIYPFLAAPVEPTSSLSTTVQVVQAPKVTQPPTPSLCFEPRLRHYEEHKGCCAEVAGLVYDRQGSLFGPRAAVIRIEGPPATNRYVGEFGVDAGGGYSITALTVDSYTIWIKGTGIRGSRFEVKYPDLANIRILVDFYQVTCR